MGAEDEDPREQVQSLSERAKSGRHCGQQLDCIFQFSRDRVGLGHDKPAVGYENEWLNQSGREGHLK